MREFPAAAPVEPTKRRVYSVSVLNRRIKELLESELAQVWVEGEISNLSRPGSGHVYFSLKDRQCQIRCALFRGVGRHVATELADGAQVLVRARVTMYEMRGDAQLVVQDIEDAGEGALRRAFEALKRKLQAEGLFDEAHKHPLPALPGRVGIITSPTGAAIRDILATFRRRFPAIPLLIYPVSVQGSGAVDDLCGALRDAQSHGRCDVLILARGGGSLEDLQAFNDERVARAVFDCAIPVVCGVGHETDVSICDFVADQRAPTPTAAAELVSPNAEDWLEGVVQAERRIARLMTGRLEQLSQRVDWLGRMVVHPRQQLRARAERLQAALGALAAGARARVQAMRLSLAPLSSRLMQGSPRARLAAARNRLERLDERIHLDARAGVESRQQRLAHVMSRLNSVNPLAVLGRGYALATEAQSRTLIKSVEQVAENTDIDVRVADGSLLCTVREKRRGE